MANVTSSSDLEELRATVIALESMYTTLEARSDATDAALNNFFLIMGAILTTLMQPGFAILEVGGAPVRNTKNILIKNILDYSCSAFAFWAFGSGLAVSPNGNAWIGTDGFFLKGDVYQDENAFYGPEEGYNYAKFFYMMTFAGSAATIVSGAGAERITLTAYFFLSFVLAGLIFPLGVRWAWTTKGWASPYNPNPLFGCGAIDFSGDAVVHACGGTAAFVSLLLLGPRYNRFMEDGRPREMAGQSSIMVALGTFLLFIGWFGFNGMSTYVAVGKAHVSAKIVVVTAMGSASAALTTAVLGYLLLGRTSPDEICNGWLAGLVSITAGCSVMEPEGAIITGAVASYLYLYASDLMLEFFIDDAVNAVPVHLVNGIWGMIAAGLFATEGNYAAAYYSDRGSECCGWFYGCGVNQLGANVVLTVAIITWTGVCSWVVLRMLASLDMLRVSVKQEQEGLDSSTHGGEEDDEKSRQLTALKSDLAQVQQLLNLSPRSEKKTDRSVSERVQSRPMGRAGSNRMVKGMSARLNINGTGGGSNRVGSRSPKGSAEDSNNNNNNNNNNNINNNNTNTNGTNAVVNNSHITSNGGSARLLIKTASGAVLRTRGKGAGGDDTNYSTGRLAEATLDGSATGSARKHTDRSGSFVRQNS